MASISLAKPDSVVRSRIGDQKKVDEAVPKHQWVIGHASVYGRKAKSKRCVLRCFLKLITVMAERVESRRLFQREEWNALAPVLVFTLGTVRLIPFVWSQCTGWGWYWNTSSNPQPNILYTLLNTWMDFLKTNSILDGYPYQFRS